MKKNDKHMVLSAENLAIGYTTKKETTAIAEDLNFSLEKGKLVCLLGKNGIGKSTLLRTLTKTQPSLTGTIFLDNEELAALSNEKLSKKLSLVLTEKIPESQLSVYEIIALGRQPYTNWLGKLHKQDLEKINNAIQQIGIEHLSQKKHYELSDGEIQKVMIARALAQDTDIIVLDEPTAHLDIHHKIEVFKLLKKLVSEIGKTIIISTHEINLSLTLADEFWLMTSQKFAVGNLEQHIEEKNFELLFPDNQVRFDPNTKQFIILN